jgi:hypothetical protein
MGLTDIKSFLIVPSKVFPVSGRGQLLFGQVDEQSAEAVIFKPENSFKEPAVGTKGKIVSAVPEQHSA